MAAFLNGLMGALKDIGTGIGSAGSKVSNGLMSMVDPALGSTPGGFAAAPGTGGAAPAGSAISDLGDFKFGPGLSVEGQTPATAPGVAKPPGFLARINTPDPTTGLSTVDKWDKFGARLQDINEGGDRAAAVDKTALQRQQKTRQGLLSQQIDQLFPNDPKMRFLLKANPDKATEAMATAYGKSQEGVNVPAGDTRLNPDGTTFMAPKSGVSDGYGYSDTPNGVIWGQERPATRGEVETTRHNIVDEGQGGQRIGLEGQRVGIEAQNAATAGGHLGVARDRLAYDKTKDGGGSGGLSGMSTADLIKALKGGH